MSFMACGTTLTLVLLIAMTVWILLISIKDSSRAYIQPSSEKLSPVLLFGGIGGNVLQTKLDSFTPKHWWCRRHVDSPFISWFDAKLLFTPQILCFFYYFIPILSADGILEDREGSITEPHDFGGLDGMAHLHPTSSASMPYYSVIINTLIQYGYIPRVNLRGAPHDWRLSVEDLAARYYFTRSKALIEQMYSDSGNTRVTLLAHSMGGIVALHLLHNTSMKWKEKYIERLVTMGTPWSGAVKCILAATSGDRLGRKMLPHNYFRPIQIMMGSTAWLYPRERPESKGDSIWGNHVFVSTTTRNYSIEHFNELHSDLGLDQLGQLYERTLYENTLSDLNPPMVNTYILYGEDIDTPFALNFPTSFVPGKVPSFPVIDTKSGDGTVLVNSAIQRPIEEWLPIHNKANISMKVTGFSSLEHLNMIKSERVVDKILSILGLLNQSVVEQI